MLFRPDERDFRLIGFYAGKVLFGVGLVMLLPAALAIVLGEGNDAVSFVIGACLAVLVGQASQTFLRSPAPLSTSHGLTAVALSYFVVPFFACIPLLLSGHYASYLDAYFESVSAFATTSLTLVNDLDHLSRSVKLWRQLMQMQGGLGIVIVVLTVFAGAAGQSGLLYSGESGDERTAPNVLPIVRFVWRLTLVYGVAGTLALWAGMILTGLGPWEGLFHASALFMAAFDSGGFSLHSANVAFYRSTLVEAILMVLMVAGAFSFALHHQLWQGRSRELLRNIETRTIAASIILIFVLVGIGLGRSMTFVDFGPLLRHGLFQLVSAHTTTGLTTIPGRLLVTDWGVLAPAMLVTAMAIGGMAGSTAGGIKAIRIGLLLKGLRRDTRKVLLPEDAVIVETYHVTTDRILRDEQVRGAATMLLLWLVLYLTGGMLAVFYGYDVTLALFESVSAGSSTGLTVGIVRPSLEWPLKLAFIVQMVTGRLEFIAVFALAGYVVSVVRGRV